MPDFFNTKQESYCMVDGARVRKLGKMREIMSNQTKRAAYIKLNVVK
jgi:hypothetical protein